jgi:protein-S-isoprenylcysteine O-methyltransferase Ste14
MRHLAFYYAIGFAIVGCLLLLAYFSTFVSMMFNNYSPFVTAALGTALALPFLIAVFSWRDWREIQSKRWPEGVREEDDA